VPYTLRYHPAVRGDDLPKISAEARRRIARTIEARLGTDPARYGAPLSGSLRGYWKLRVGDYLVVFKVAAEDVWILAVVHRRDVYERAPRRLR
jgi:mRNA interferase RelE/StbE